MALPTSSSISTCILGAQTLVCGTLSGQEDLVIEGRVEGKIQLEGHVVVAEHGAVEASIDAHSIVVHGDVVGDLTATRAITIEKGARVQGNLSAPSVLVHDGAHFCGGIDMDMDLPESIAKSLSR